MKKIIFILCIYFFINIIFVYFSHATNIENGLKGRILLQVESNGEAWYVNPSNEKRYYLGRPADALRIMKYLGLGVSNKDFDVFNGVAPENLSGKILIKVEENGKAFYVNPINLKMNYLGRPSDAFHIIRKYGLGITNNDILNIPIEELNRSYIRENTISNTIYGGPAHRYLEINKCKKNDYKCETDKFYEPCIALAGKCNNDIHIKSFEDFGYQYGKDENAIFHWGHKISNADRNTFEVVNNYAGDNNNIYWYGKVIEGADLRTFKVLNGYTAIDKNNVYCEGIKREDFDYKSLKIINFEHMKDVNGVYFECRPINLDSKTTESLSYYCAKDDNSVYCRHTKLKNIDTSSLKIINDKYCKDNNNVYLIERENLRKIEDADPETFEEIDNDFSKDNNNIFYRYNKLSDLDISSFEIIATNHSGSRYIKDRNEIYRVRNEAVIIKGADIDTFQILNINYNKDENNVYYQGQIMDEADVNTFFALGDYSLDKNSIFYLNKKISNNTENFKELGKNMQSSFAKDNDNIYCNGEILKNVDLKSFEINNKSENIKYGWIKGWDARDKNNYYLSCKAQ